MKSIGYQVVRVYEYANNSSFYTSNEVYNKLGHFSYDESCIHKSYIMKWKGWHDNEYIVLYFGQMEDKKFDGMGICVYYHGDTMNREKKGMYWEVYWGGILEERQIKWKRKSYRDN